MPWIRSKEDRFMRRKECEITDPQKIHRILAATPIGRLATTGSDGYPYITPVNFVFYQGEKNVKDRGNLQKGT
jgi:nitroimidazol reductase NimA-like FMN-containing flavoprotein (pyridoxamine 5'-phosphate oxidase superfamily)